MEGKKKIIILITILLTAISVTSGDWVFPQEKGKKKGMAPPPSPVVVAKITKGAIAPHQDFTGSVFFHTVSDLSSEVSGKVDEVFFEEGDRVKKNQVLLQLNSEVLEKRLDVISANYEEALVELEKSKLDLKRIKKLFKEDSVAEQTFDDYRYKVTGLDRKVASLASSVKQLKVELDKKRIRAPFEGVIIEKFANPGEWFDPGVKVATIAELRVFDIVVDVPGTILPYVKKGMEVDIFAGEKAFKGGIFAIIPTGDISTRTFPVKIKVTTDLPLFGGMEAVVALPSGAKKESFIIARDGIVSSFGRQGVFIVTEGKALMIPVIVTGYSGLMAGITSDKLKEGMEVVVKGNERLRPGQPVKPIPSKGMVK